ncbi:MAG: hypothetical protein NTW69_00625 [Chloroflexi bacterium]|nr:hypothetical protein [Chloroflexota bacterium]
MPITYATSHIDGGLDCSSLSIGVLITMSESPIVKVMVIAGLQAHPVWAIDRLAVVIYCYVQSANYHYPRGPRPIQVNVRGSLISNDSTSCVVAGSFSWHTSEAIRMNAERLIAKMTSGNQLTAQWPTKTKITLPIQGETLYEASTLASSG